MYASSSMGIIGIIVLLFFLITVILFICMYVWIFQEAQYRVGASPFKALVFSIFATPIAGLLYLLLYKRYDQ